MKRIIFLDFDGVLNTENYQAHLSRQGMPQWDEFGQLFDPFAVENLRLILEAFPDALLVINSSWKLEGLGRMKELWASRKLPGRIHSITPDYVPDLANLDLADENDIAFLAGKGNEVKQWLVMNAPGECRYVVLDDVPFFPKEMASHFIQINPETGITKEDVEKAIHILK